MDFFSCVKGRRSIREFEEKAVSREVFEEIVASAAFAPSWKNTQVTRYTLIEDSELKNKIADDCMSGFVYNSNNAKNAPALVIVSMITGRSGFERDGSYSTSKEDRWEVFDAGIATQTFCLTAHALGLGTVVMGVFDEEKVAKVVGIPEGQKVAAILAIGYPKGEVQAPKRKSVEELVSYR